MKIIRALSFFVLVSGSSSPLLATEWFGFLKSLFRYPQNTMYIRVPDNLVEVIASYSESPFENMTIKSIASTDSTNHITRGKLSIEKILNERSFVIESLITAKSKGIKEKEGWTRLAYNILTVMYAINDNTPDAAQDLATDAALKAASIDGLVEARRSAEKAANTSPWRAASDAARRAARKAAWDASEASYQAAWNTPMYESLKPDNYQTSLDLIISELTSANLSDPSEIGELAYETANKAVLFCLLKHERESFKTIYAASEQALKVPKENIFVSSKKWKEFRKLHFGKLNKDDPYLRPYLEGITWIVKNKIDSSQ